MGGLVITPVRRDPGADGGQLRVAFPDHRRRFPRSGGIGQIVHAVHQPFGVVDPANRGQGPGVDAQDARMRREYVVRKAIDPARQEVGFPTDKHQDIGVAVDQGGGAGEVLDRQRVFHRLADQAVPFVPLGCPRVQLFLSRIRQPGEIGQQHVPEQAVVTIPGAFVVERKDEEIGARRLGQQFMGVRAGLMMVARPGRGGRSRSDRSSRECPRSKCG